MAKAESEQHDVDDRTDRWQYRIFGVFVVAIVFFLAYLLTEILWHIDKAALLFIAISLAGASTIVVATKLLYHREKVSLINGLILRFAAVAVVVVIWLFNATAIPELAAYQFGIDSPATVKNLNIKGRNSRYVVYDFSIDSIQYTKEQGIEIATYDSMKSGQSIAIRYLGSYPEISVFIDDGYLKPMVVLALGISAGTITSMYSAQLKKQAILALQRIRPPNPVL